MRLLFFVFMLLFNSSCAHAAPIDVDATPYTVALYNNLSTSRYINLGISWGDSTPNEQIEAITGYLPSFSEGAIQGSTAYGATIGEPWGQVSLQHIAYFNAGTMIGFSWHLMNIDTGGTHRDTTGDPCGSIITGGDKQAEYQSYLDNLADWANGLMADTAIILRLFHENDSDWFWWGIDSCTDSQYKQLYQETVTYLRDTKHVHNLLYAYSPNVVNGYAYDGDRYPGDAYVDIFGIDAYTNADDLSAVFTRYQAAADAAVAHNKIFAITEGMRDNKNYYRPDYWTWYMTQVVNDAKVSNAAYILFWESDTWGAIDGREDAPDFAMMASFPQIYLIGKTMGSNIQNATINDATIR